jgi:hypothetical protein
MARQRPTQLFSTYYANPATLPEADHQSLQAHLNDSYGAPGTPLTLLHEAGIINLQIVTTAL